MSEKKPHTLEQRKAFEKKAKAEKMLIEKGRHGYVWGRTKYAWEGYCMALDVCPQFPKQEKAKP